MGVWNQVKSFFQKSALTLKRPDGWPGYNHEDITAVGVNDQSSLMSSAYYSSLLVICNTVAILPKSVHRRTSTGSEKDREHDQFYLINKRANRYQSSSAFWKEFTFNRKHRGNGCAWLEGVEGRRGRPLAYWNLNPLRIEVDFQDGDAFWRYLEKLPDGRKIEGWRPWREILHVPGDIPGVGFMGGIWGQKTLNFAADDLSLDLTAKKATGSYIQKNGVIKTYFKHPLPLKPEQRQEIAGSLKEYGEGGKRENEKPLLHGGMSLEALNVNLNDINMDSVRTSAIESAARFNVFPALFKIAHHDRSNFANAYQASIEFVTTSMLPITQAYQEELDYKILRTTEQDTHFVNFEYKTLLQAEPREQAEFLRSVFNMGGVTPNIVADILDMPTMGESGDLTYIMNNMIPTDMVREYWRNIMGKAGEMTPKEARDIVMKAMNGNGVH